MSQRRHNSSSGFILKSLCMHAMNLKTCNKSKIN
jgi:hypothetical protein